MRTILQNIHKFLAQANEIFFNEADFQQRLALYLEQTGQYKKIFLEYFVPNAHVLCPQNRWKNDMHIDIVVLTKKGEYVPIELKYKTKQVNTNFYVFDDTKNPPISPVKHIGANNEGCYDFWKDVCRIEILKSTYSKVVGGFAIFLTNDALYWNGPSTLNVQYAEFSMKNDPAPKGTSRWWLDKTGKRTSHRFFDKNGNPHDSRPSFDLNCQYATVWDPTTLCLNGNGVAPAFQYCLVQI